MALVLQFLLERIEIFDIKKTPFRYVYSCETVDKGACITRMGAARNCRTNTMMEKDKHRSGRGG